ncbi:HNH endonuclease signature motif containing protein [Salimicrobium salexigens]|uniref:5-methylcytosine-specific restriction endonuclease McrA n=1 Tax=Salimicrobium salexigens TaxID=908941 RepID=A0ABY1KX91_9BACI|nr:HNH endonuclease domain-containing protein [Salimicrobium salexigens]SIS88757.1 5-methylcytosine-specific restriction endonuclease McrA [Salimicrobium salexigens]
MSWKSGHGTVNSHSLEEDEIWYQFTMFFYKSKKTQTYKFGLLKALIENLYNADSRLQLTYDQIGYSFVKTYWNLVVRHGLKQGSQNSGVAAAVLRAREEWQLPIDLSFDQLQAGDQVYVLECAKPIMKKYVFGALYSDFEGKLYGFDRRKQSEYFQFHPDSHLFLLKYQRLVTDLVNYHLAKMIEHYNPVTREFLLRKVESVAQRESLHPYRDILLSRFENSCFYCGRSLHLSQNQTHVDHFIPWSFIQSDNIWNLVLSCRACNLNKSDKLPDYNYLECILERNEHLKAEPVLLYEDRSLYNYRPEKLKLLYEYSEQNGFEERWSP